MKDVRTVARALAGGAVVGFPTETVYGIGASARQPQAVATLFSLTERPLDKPVLLHVRDLEALDAFARDLPSGARALAESFWPGPLTLVVPRHERVDALIAGGGETIGLRAPDHPVMWTLLETLGALEGGPPAIAGTSANRSGETPPVTVQSARAQLPDAVQHVLDGGPCPLGIESTVLSLVRRPTILRPGAIPRRHLEVVLGSSIESAAVPGSAPATLNVIAFEGEGPAEPIGPDDGVISWAAAPSETAARWIVPGTSPAAYARGLFAAVSELEAAGVRRVFIARLPQDDGTGVAEAVNARIERLSGNG